MPYNPSYGLEPYLTQAPVLTDIADIEQAFNYFYYGQATATSTPPLASLYGWLQNLQTQITTIADESRGAGNVEPGPNPPTVTPDGNPVPNGWIWVDDTASSSFYQYNASAIWALNPPTENLALGLLWVQASSPFTVRVWAPDPNTGINGWQDIVGVGPVWGAIQGTLSNQTDLITALNLKAPIASPSFTGTTTVVSAPSTGSTSVRNATISTVAPTNAQGSDGDLWFVYV